MMEMLDVRRVLQMRDARCKKQPACNAMRSIAGRAVSLRLKADGFGKSPISNLKSAMRRVWNSRMSRADAAVVTGIS